ncbi:hypothetical protein GCM10023189_42940 [Nibrella saemangeumensis]|uniref:Uncharacterized protein n=1 Tax=Nibrella saemangeumensis TaxID=1084526 RepID=A0ABP8NAK0_9BACT
MPFSITFPESLSEKERLSHIEGANAKDKAVEVAVRCNGLTMHHRGKLTGIDLLNHEIHVDTSAEKQTFRYFCKAVYTSKGDKIAYRDNVRIEPEPLTELHGRQRIPVAMLDRLKIL